MHIALLKINREKLHIMAPIKFTTTRQYKAKNTGMLAIIITLW